MFMKAILPLIATVTSIAAPVQFQTAPVYGNLFDGRTLTGWRATGNASIWTVKDGAIVGINDEKKSGSTLYTKTKYEDFDLTLKVMWTGIVDSGVFLRKPELQVQLGQSNSLKVDMSCCFYTGTKGDIYPQAGRGKGVAALLKEGQWNTLRVRARGDRFEVWLNGTKTTDYTNAGYPGSGPIGLQVHPGLAMSVQFKDIVVKSAYGESGE
jgi:hypothetical protein